MSIRTNGQSTGLMNGRMNGQSNAHRNGQMNALMNERMNGIYNLTARPGAEQAIQYGFWLAVGVIRIVQATRRGQRAERGVADGEEKETGQ